MVIEYANWKILMDKYGGKFCRIEWKEFIKGNS